MARTTVDNIGNPIGGATSGSILFVGSTGQLAQDNGSLYFDDTNNRVGLLTTAPTHTLTFGSTSTGISIYNTSDQTTNYERIRAQRSSNRFDITVGSGGSGSSRNLRLGINATGADTSGGTAYIDFASTVITYSSRSSPTNTIGHSMTIGSGGSTMSSGLYSHLSITPTIVHTSTAGYTGILCNVTETSTGSGSKNLMLLQVGGSTKFGVDNTGAFSCSNAVGVGVAVASTHKVTCVISGSTYYLLASNV